MKKKKLIATLCLLAAVIMLGVGYALTSGTLTINGTVNIAKSNSFDVEFSAAACKDALKAGNGTCDSAGTGLWDTSSNPAAINNDMSKSYTAVMEVDLTKVNDAAGATFTVKNFSTDLKADFSKATVTISKTTNGGYFNVSDPTSIVTGWGVVDANTVAGSFDVTITQLKENISDTDPIVGKFIITIEGIEAVAL